MLMWLKSNKQQIEKQVSFTFKVGKILQSNIAIQLVQAFFFLCKNLLISSTWLNARVTKGSNPSLIAKSSAPGIEI